MSDSTRFLSYYQHVKSIRYICIYAAEQGAPIIKALEMAMEKYYVGAPHGRDRICTVRVEDNDDVKEWFDRRFFEDGMEPEACNAQSYAGERKDWILAVGNLFDHH